MADSGERKVKKVDTLGMIYTALGAVLIAVCSLISIPTTVPFTLQTFAVACVLCLLGGKRGTLSILIYILLGSVGVPVFAGMKGGVGVLLGTTGGYIVGFLFMGLIYILAEAILKEKIKENGFKAGVMICRAVVLIIGLAVCYAFGTIWFMLVYANKTGPIGVGMALAWCVIPFIIPDLVKMILAVVLASRLRKIIKI